MNIVAWMMSVLALGLAVANVQLRMRIAGSHEELLLLPQQGTVLLLLLLLLMLLMLVAVLRLLPCLCRHPHFGHSSECRPLRLRLVSLPVQWSGWRVLLVSRRHTQQLGPRVCTLHRAHLRA